jgi:HD-GYP domain-containing protein (c-di-GMP phosphodiesterase class II)
MVPFFGRYRSFSLRSRAGLIGATVLLQALVVGVGVLLAGYFAQSGVSQRMMDASLDTNGRAASRFAALLARDLTAPLAPGSESWSKAQALVEEYRLGGGATLLIVDRAGRLVCHPHLRENPNLSRVDYSALSVRLHPSGEEWLLQNLTSQSVLSGTSETMGIPLVVSMVYQPALDVKVVVLQTRDSVAAAGRRVTEGAMVWAGIAALVVLGLTAGGSILLVRRYDSLLARSNRTLEAEVARRTRRAVAIRNGLIFGLAKLADYRDTDTGKHLERICRYCDVLARVLAPKHPEITPEWIERLKLASSMHDIGKVGIPDTILLKPGKLTCEERSLMERHAMMGADTLLAIRKRVGTDELLDMSIVVAQQHHERWDGTGYPGRLAGREIALAARIVACADIYDALTSARVYKPAMTHEEARAIIVRSRGTHLDPEVVDAFESVHERFDEIRHELSPVDGVPEVPMLARVRGEVADAVEDRAVDARVDPALDPDMPRACIMPATARGQARPAVEGQEDRTAA